MVAGTQAGQFTNSVPYGMPCVSKELDLSCMASNNTHRKLRKIRFQLKIDCHSFIHSLVISVPFKFLKIFLPPIPFGDEPNHMDTKIDYKQASTPNGATLTHQYKVQWWWWVLSAHTILVLCKALHDYEFYYSIAYSNGMVHGSSMWGGCSVIWEYHLWLSAEAAT